MRRFPKYWIKKVEVSIIMKEKTSSNVINEKSIYGILRLIFCLSLLPTIPNISEIRQFVCSRLNLTSEEFGKIEKFLLRNGFAVRYGGRKLLLTPKGVLYVLWRVNHERK